MSKAIICDICEKNISVENSEKIRRGHRTEYCYRIIRTGKGVFRDLEKKYDVCQSCFEFIQNLVKEAKE